MDQLSQFVLDTRLYFLLLGIGLMASVFILGFITRAKLGELIQVLRQIEQHMDHTEQDRFTAQFKK